MLVRLGLPHTLLGPCCFHLSAGQRKISLIPKKAVAVPYSMEARMLVPDIVAAMLPSLKVEWGPISCGY